jgi:hypothetical protein
MPGISVSPRTPVARRSVGRLAPRGKMMGHPGVENAFGQRLLQVGLTSSAASRECPLWAGINQVEQESGRSFRDSQGLLHLNFVALTARAAEDRAIR